MGHPPAPGEKAFEKIEALPIHTDKELLEKAARFCAYRERSISEVADKLHTLGATDEQKKKIIAKLLEEKFIDESRFVGAFVRGKFRVNKWGKLKIKAELAQKGLDRKQIEKALQEIDEREYAETLKKLVEKKARELKKETPAKARVKLMRFTYSKGFEPEAAGKIIAQLLKA